MLNNQPIFIVGSPRSGTTLMRYCLNRHSRIYIPPETNFFVRVYGNRNLLLTPIEKNADKLVTRFLNFHYNTMAEFHHLKDFLINRVARDAENYTDVANIIFGEIAKEKGKVRWGEKTPGHVFYIDRILDLFPDAKIINLQRSHKNVLASYVKCSHLPDDFISACAVYKLSVDAAKKYSDRIFNVQYDELTCNPEKVLINVCQYIGENFEPAMLQPGMRDSSYQKQALELNDSIGIIPENPDKWKQVISEDLENFINWIMQDGEYTVNSRCLVLWTRMMIKYYLMILQITKNSWGYEKIKTCFSPDWQ